MRDMHETRHAVSFADFSYLLSSGNVNIIIAKVPGKKR